MRTLSFIVEGQSIKQDPSCDFSGLVPGSRGYLKASFTFNADWSGCEKMAVFSKHGLRDRVAVQLKNGACTIPEEVLNRRMFKVSVIGVNQGLRLVTNTLEVNQDG